MERKFSQPVADTITNGIDLSLFYPEGRVLMQYSPLEWKGLADGLRAWEMARKECLEARLVMFGLKRGPDVPPDVEFHQDPPQDELRRLYSSCDIFLFPSWSEGYQLPPMEAMACGCAVVATNVGGVPDYAIPGETALVVEPHNVEGMARALLRLLRDKAERRQIAEADPAWLAEATSALEAHLHIGFSASKMLFYERRDRVNSAGLFLRVDGVGRDIGYGQPDGPELAAMREVFGASGGALYRQAMLEDRGWPAIYGKLTALQRLPATLAKRKAIMQARRVSDAYIDSILYKGFQESIHLPGPGAFRGA